MVRYVPGLVSILTPTRNRPGFLARCRAFVRAQDYQPIEWLILDDSVTPDPAFLSDASPGIAYEHVSRTLSLGEKRNLLVERARGEFIVQFDDDDFYRSDYVTTVGSALSRHELDIINFKGWFLLDLRNGFFGYWDLLLKQGHHYCCDGPHVTTAAFPTSPVEDLEGNEFGYGFSYSFRREVWERHKFDPISLGEDSAFFRRAIETFRTGVFYDRGGLCLHILHKSSTSRCFPQYRLPSFLLTKLFPESAYKIE